VKLTLLFFFTLKWEFIGPPRYFITVFKKVLIITFTSNLFFSLFFSEALLFHLVF